MPSETHLSRWWYPHPIAGVPRSPAAGDGRSSAGVSAQHRGMTESAWQEDWEDDLDEYVAEEVDAPANPLGVVVQAERARRGWSQRDLAQRAGLSQAVVSRLERGNRSPSWALFCQLLEAMDLEPAVSAVARSSSTDRLLERLRPLSPDARLQTQYVESAVAAFAQALSGLEWAMDGNAALLAHGVPVCVDALTVAILDEDNNLAAVLDRVVRKRWVEVLGATAEQGTARFAVTKCAEVMRRLVNDMFRASGWPCRLRLVPSVSGSLRLAGTADAEIMLLPVDRVRPDDAAALAALARWAARVSLEP